MCLLLFKHEIHFTVLHPDRKQCSLMFRVKIKESLFYICAYEKNNNCNSLFAKYALFLYCKGRFLRAFLSHGICGEICGAEERGGQLNLGFRLLKYGIVS